VAGAEEKDSRFYAFGKTTTSKEKLPTEPTQPAEPTFDSATDTPNKVVKQTGIYLVKISLVFFIKYSLQGLRVRMNSKSLVRQPLQVRNGQRNQINQLCQFSKLRDRTTSNAKLVFQR
jgi:hypothetical protein